jgi:hypothetical protein
MIVLQLAYTALLGRSVAAPLARRKRRGEQFIEVTLCGIGRGIPAAPSPRTPLPLWASLHRPRPPPRHSPIVIFALGLYRPPPLGGGAASSP